jgi:hypothetical protein
MYYYINEKEITSEEAHALRDKTGLIVSDVAITFKKEKKEKKVKKHGSK